MKHSRVFHLMLAIALTLAAGATPCLAISTFSLEFSQSMLNIRRGSTASVDVIFTETVTGGTDFLLGSDSDFGINGLTAARFDIVRSGGGENEITSATATPAMSFSFDPVLSTPVVRFDNASGLDDTPLTGMVAGNRRSLTLGTVFLTGGSLGDTNTFFFNLPSGDNFLVDDGFGGASFIVDPTVFGSLRVNAVPEPGTLTLLGIAGAGWIARRRRACARLG